MKDISKNIIDRSAEIIESALLVLPFAALHIFNVLMNPFAHNYLSYVR